MISKLKRALRNNVKNIPGWRTNRKIVVIECDDWGGIRMPSSEAREAMINKGLAISDSRFDKYDTIANRDDLEQLFEVLESVKDRSGNHAVMTPLVVVANPDFDKIKEDDFLSYYHEPFTKTIKGYYPDQDVFSLWQEGMERKIFIPGLHGRDHIAVPFWMEKLQEGNDELRTAFDYGYVSLEIPGVPEPVSGFRAEYYFNAESQRTALKQAIKESISVFKSVFGHSPAIFVPGNGVFHSDFDQTLVENGVPFLNVLRRTPHPDVNGDLKYKRFISGQKGPGITYYTRNCAFEPTDDNYTGIEHILEQIAAALRWGKPAIISTHRVNFIGGIDPKIREMGLMELNKLLSRILTKWPDVEFLSSADMLHNFTNSDKD